MLLLTKQKDKKMSSNIRVIKHRIKQSLKNGKPASLNNLQTLKNANINIKPFIRESKKIYDSLLKENIQETKQNEKV